MAAFNFPDPTIQQTVTNPITGSTYQWKEPPGKWVVTSKIRAVSDIIYEGDNPPIPRGDYKLWYSTDTLELYFWYEDENGVGAWLPTSVPITAIEDLAAFAAEAEVDIDQLQYKQQLLQNALDQIYLDQQTGVSARSPIFSNTEPTVHPDFTAPDNGLVAGDIWYDTTDLEQLIEYVYDGTQWILTGNYVKKKGDTMTGALTMDDANILLDNGNLEFEAKGDTAYVQDVNNRFGKIVSRAPRDTDLDSTDFSSVFGVEINLSEGNTFKNNLVVANQQGNILKITSGTGAQVEFGTSGFIPNQTNTGLTSGIAIRHIPTPSFENSPGDLAVN